MGWVIFFTLFSLFSLAAERAVVGKPTIEQAEKSPADPGSGQLQESVAEKPNKYHIREDKTMDINWVLISSTSNLIGGGLNTGYFLNRDSILQLDISAGFSLSTLGGGSLIFGEMIGLKYKRFLGKSLYLTSGILHERLEFTGAPGLVTAPQNSAVHGKSSTVGGTLGIGTQKHWSWATVGCDWLGIYVPLVKRSLSVSSESDVSQADFLERSDIFKKFRNSIRYSLFRFYVGASF